MEAPAQWLTLRELDTRAARPKGAAFRAFKALEPGLRRDRDFMVLERGDGFDRLRAEGRAYASSVKLILVAPAVAQEILASLR